jgi:hypothetical protein
MEDFQPRPCDPPFILELAHYEWVELALDVSEEELPEPQPVVDLLAGVPRLSPLAWVLAYQYPVHRIGPSFRPAEPGEGVYLAVYRDREDKVQFMELNAATARLLELIRDNEQATVVAVLQALAGELGMEPTALQEFGAGQLAQFVEKSVVLVTETADEAVASGDCGG